MKRSIHVRNINHGTLYAEDITVQRFGFDEVLEFCNHAAAVEEAVQVEHYRPDQPDIVYDQTIITCDKCPAWRVPGENEWNDAPSEGVHDV